MVSHLWCGACGNTYPAGADALASQEFDALKAAINSSQAAAVDGSCMRLGREAATPEWHDTWRAAIEQQALFHARLAAGDSQIRAAQGSLGI